MIYVIKSNYLSYCISKSYINYNRYDDSSLLWSNSINLEDRIKISKPPTVGPESQNDIGGISPSVNEQTHVVHIIKQNKDANKNFKLKDLGQSISQSK